MSNQQHIIQATVTEFPKVVGNIVSTRNVALEANAFAFNGKHLACVIDESQRPPSAPGSLIEVTAVKTKDPQGFIDGLAAQNPQWKVRAVFPVSDDTKGKASTVVVASLHQP